MSSLAELVLQLGDEQCAARLYDVLHPYARLMVSHDLLRTVSGSVESLLGRLSAGAGRNRAALQHLERGLVKEERFGAAPACERTRAALAGARLADGPPRTRAPKRRR
jgi:hypothetical protein